MLRHLLEGLILGSRTGRGHGLLKLQVPLVLAHLPRPLHGAEVLPGRTSTELVVGVSFLPLDRCPHVGQLHVGLPQLCLCDLVVWLPEAGLSHISLDEAAQQLLICIEGEQGLVLHVLVDVLQETLSSVDALDELPPCHGIHLPMLVGLRDVGMVGHLLEYLLSVPLEHLQLGLDVVPVGQLEAVLLGLGFDGFYCPILDSPHHVFQLIDTVKHVCEHLHGVLLPDGVLRGVVAEVQLRQRAVDLCLAADLRDEMEGEEEGYSHA
mmetsp:Transcript_30072/g.84881  ORF Transcript_30072/g.84881 Transcript_30072/m.84881 type:complete len:265 (+) Transcript_30072:390-1184(+)